MFAVSCVFACMGVRCFRFVKEDAFVLGLSALQGGFGVISLSLEHSILAGHMRYCVEGHGQIIYNNVNVFHSAIWVLLFYF